MQWKDLAGYLEAASRYPLLNREEEIALVKVIRDGEAAQNELDALKARHKRGRVPKAEASALQKRMDAGLHARERFLKANLRLVVSIAKGWNVQGLPLEDRVQEGNIGMMHALDKFDPTKGFKFSTYASWWIRQAISRASQHADTIRLPAGKHETRSKLQRTTQQLERKLGRPPSDEEIAEWAGVTLNKVRQSRDLPQVACHLDDPVTDDGITLAEVLEDEDAAEAELRVILDDMRNKRSQLFKGFAPRDVLMFDLRYGEIEHSLEDIGKVFGLTRERVRQIILRQIPVLRERALAMGMTVEGL